MESHVRPQDAQRAGGPAGSGILGELGLDGDVEVIAVLERGAGTAVYRIRRDGVDYALKVLQRSSLGEESGLTRFRREAALLARVNHPGVPKVFDVGTGGGQVYMVQEFIDGQVLSRRLEAGRLSPDEVRRLAVDVAEALTAAHRAGLVHRDIKPANIVMTAEGRGRVIDFGLAAGRTTVAGDAVVGTFDYSAPEQTGMLARPVDGRADLYALGVVLFESATGQLPYRADDLGQLLAMHATAPVPDPRVLRPDLPPDLAELICRLLAKDPDDRIQSAHELGVALGGPSGTTEESAARPAEAMLVGREREQARLAARWDLARAGRGGFALLHGPAGGGKSSLARGLADTAGGGLVLSGRCAADSSLPLGGAT